MNKFEFLSQLSGRLGGLSPEDRRRVTDYYSEMIDDRMEEGFSEEEAVQSIGDPSTDAREMLSAMGIEVSEAEASAETPAITPAQAASAPVQQLTASVQDTVSDPEKNIIEETVEEELRSEGRLASEKNYGNAAEEAEEKAAGENTGAAGLSDEAIARAIRNISENPRPEGRQVPEERKLPEERRRTSSRRKALSWIIIAALVIFGTAMTISVTKKTFNFTGRLFPFGIFSSCEEFSYDAGKVESMVIHTSSGDVRFEDSKSNEITVSFPKSSSDEYKVTLDKGTLTIEHQAGINFSFLNFFGIFTNDNDVVIGLPFSAQKKKGAEMELKDLSIETSSGDVTLPEALSLNGELNIKCSSGEIYSEALLRLSKGEIRTSSGDVDIRCRANTYGFAEELSVNTSSGEIDIRSLSINSLKTESTSGDVSAEDVKVSALSIQTTSGEVEYSEAKNAGVELESFRIKTTSGDVKVSLNEVPEIKTHATSGTIKIPRTNGKEGDFEISTTSGDISVKQY